MERGAALSSDGVLFEPCGLDNRDGIARLCEGKDWVFHCGAKSSVWGTRADFWEANVQGTRNVMEGCLDAGVKRVVHISTPAVYFGFKDALGVSEDASLPLEPVNIYAASKLEAESVVSEAVSRGLHAVVLRPRAIFGAGDTALFPRLLRNIESGRFKIIGDETATLDFTYIDNCVEACILSASVDNVTPGRVFNITDGEEIKLWYVLRHVTESLGLEFPTKRISTKKAIFAATVLEWFHRTFRPKVEPLLTRYSVGILTGSLTLDISRARSELGYQPKVSTMVGIERFLSHLKANQ